MSLNNDGQFVGNHLTKIGHMAVYLPTTDRPYGYFSL